MTLRDQVQNGMSVMIDLAGNDLENLIALGVLAKADALLPRTCAMKVQAFLGEAIKERARRKQANVIPVILEVPADFAVSIAARQWVGANEASDPEALAKAFMGIAKMAIDDLCVTAYGAAPDGSNFALSRISLDAAELEMMELAGKIEVGERRPAVVTKVFRDLALTELDETLGDYMTDSKRITLRISDDAVNKLQLKKLLPFGETSPEQIAQALGRFINIYIERGLPASTVAA